MLQEELDPEAAAAARAEQQRRRDKNRWQVWAPWAGGRCGRLGRLTILATSAIECLLWVCSAASSSLHSHCARTLITYSAPLALHSSLPSQMILIVAGIQVALCLFGVFSIYQIAQEVQHLVELHPRC